MRNAAFNLCLLMSRIRQIAPAVADQERPTTKLSSCEKEQRAKGRCGESISDCSFLRCFESFSLQLLAPPLLLLSLSHDDNRSHD